MRRNKEKKNLLFFFKLSFFLQLCAHDRAFGAFLRHSKVFGCPANSQSDHVRRNFCFLSFSEFVFLSQLLASSASEGCCDLGSHDAAAKLFYKTQSKRKEREEKESSFLLLYLAGHKQAERVHQLECRASFRSSNRDSCVSPSRVGKQKKNYSFLLFLSVRYHEHALGLAKKHNEHKW